MHSKHQEGINTTLHSFVTTHFFIAGKSKYSGYIQIIIMGLAKVATVVAFVAALCAVVLGGGYGHGRYGDYGMMGYSGGYSGGYNAGFGGGYGAYYSAPMYSYGYMSPGYGLYGAAQGITQGVGTAIGGVAGGISALLPLIIMVIVVIFILGFL